MVAGERAANGVCQHGGGLGGTPTAVQIALEDIAACSRLSKVTRRQVCHSILRGTLDYIVEGIQCEIQNMKWDFPQGLLLLHRKPGSMESMQNTIDEKPNS